MRVVVKKLGLLLFFITTQLGAFEVKVLLQKEHCSTLENNPIHILSSHGFVVSHQQDLSVGDGCKDPCISLTSQDNALRLMHKPVTTKLCYITPALSREQKRALSSYVSNWFEEHKKVLLVKSEALHAFFDHFVEKKSVINSISYNLLVKYVYDVIDLFLQHMLQTIDSDNVVSLQTLQRYIKQFLQDGIKDQFLDQLASKQLARKDRKLLQNNQEYRYEFFVHHVHQMIYNMLQKFCVVLPRSVISKLLKEDVGTLEWNGNKYLGSFVILQDGGTVHLVNCLDIDDYLLSVIRHEGWPGWPLEVNKVLAIACRTYLVWQVMQAQKSKRAYHIENGIRHQTYKGHHKYDRLKQAIDETKDLCLASDGKPILAMFDSCCGGIIPAHIDNKDYKKHSYLQREESCDYCKGCKIANWKAEFEYDDMVQRLQKDIHSLTSIDDMKVIKTDNAGLVKTVDIETKDAHIHVSGKKMYSLFPEIKSFCFDIEAFPKKKEHMHVKEGGRKTKRKQKAQQLDHLVAENEDIKKFVIHGKGYGHHVGLCQWGAMKLVRDHHWPYQRILQFYYPETQLIKLTYQR